MTKQEYIIALESLIEDAEKNNPLLASVLLSVIASLYEESLNELSNYTAAFSLQQINKHKAQQN